MTNQRQNMRIRRLADELQRLQALGAPVDPEMLRLAAWLLRPDRRVKLHESPIQGPILRLLSAADAPRLGYLTAEIVAYTGLTPAQVNVCLKYMTTVGMVARFDAPRRCRYFRTKAGLEAVREQLVQLEAMRRVVRPVALPKEPKPAPPPKPASVEKPRREVSAVSRRHFNAPISSTQVHLPRVAGVPRAPAPSLPPPVVVPPPARRSVFEARAEPIVPPHVQVQKLPSGRDTRFLVEHPITDGFAAEWKRLRGAKE